jgi:hypothetical protein
VGVEQCEPETVEHSDKENYDITNDLNTMKNDLNIAKDDAGYSEKVLKMTNSHDGNNGQDLNGKHAGEFVQNKIQILRVRFSEDTKDKISGD